MSDSPGEKPAPLNIEAIVANADKIEKIGQQVESEVPAPDYASAKPSEALSPGLPNPPLSTEDGGRNVMAASFNPNVTVPEYIRGSLEQLNGIQKFFHGRDVQKLTRSQVLKITKELFEYQFKDMQHLLMLGMDVQKKTRFVQYLNATKSLQNRIQNESAEAQIAVVNTMFENRIDAYKTKNNRDVELDTLLRKGVLDKEQYEKTKEDNARRTSEHVQRLDQTADLLLTRHAEFLYKTLELFKTKLIESGML